MRPPASTSEPSLRKGLPLGAKVGIASTLLAAGLALLAYLSVVEIERTRIMDAKLGQAQAVVDQFALSAALPLEFDDAIEAEMACATLAEGRGISSAALWREGGEAPLAAVSGAGAKSDPTPTSTPTVGVQWRANELEIAHRIEGADGGPVGIASVTFSLEDELQAVEALQTQLAKIAAAIALGVGMVLMLGARWLVVRPIRGLSRAADAVRRGDRSFVDVRSGDELGELAVAFNRMQRAIDDREGKLSNANAELSELLDNMRQAVFAVDEKFAVAGKWSRAAEQLFAQPRLDGFDVRTFLLDGLDDSSPEHDALSVWSEVVFGATPETWNDLAELAPTDVRLTLPSRGEVELALEFRPLWHDQTLTRLMVLATDVTEKRRVEREVEALRSRHEAEMAAMRRNLAAGPQLLVAFLRQTPERLRRVRALLCDDGSAAIDEAFRIVHGVKGEARAFGLLDLEDTAFRLEDTLAMLRSKRSAEETTSEKFAELRRLISSAEGELQRATQRIVQSSPLGEAVLDQTTVSASKLDALVELVAPAEGPRTASMDQVAGAVAELAARPFGEVFSGLLDAVPTWAAQRGKEARLKVEGTDTRVPANLATRLRTVVVHLVRNAIAHGIEPVDVRQNLGKPELGAITARCKTVEGGVRIEIEDDGSGVDVQALRDRLQHLSEHEGPTSDSGVYSLMFRDGVSARDDADELAGRGVGLAAVRSLAAEVGYHVFVISERGTGTTFVIEPQRR